MNKVFKQQKDMTPGELDEFKIHRLLKRKADTEAKGKTYKPRMTGDIPRLIKEYPDSFKWMAAEVVTVSKPVVIQQPVISTVPRSISAEKEIAGLNNRIALALHRAENAEERAKNQEVIIKDYQNNSSLTPNETIAELRNSIEVKDRALKAYHFKAKEKTNKQEFNKDRFKAIEKQLKYYQELAESRK